ncbi:small ribosomal subunit protein uS13-like [Rattus norvegicus]|uniref:small ribosomal subunit protein uS13-like n=1 Tax=Rattus norvegicus TaxID=10116 RepID=UPI0004E48C3F|nr:40S ribosomal protein S18-like [Rattus norvegicus]
METGDLGKKEVPEGFRDLGCIGRGYALVVLRKADIDLTKKAREFTEEEAESVRVQDLKTALEQPEDVKVRKCNQVLASSLDNKLREDLEQLRKIRAHGNCTGCQCLRI